MKYIILGLGNFGGSLAEKLTRQGNEVIGVDSYMERVDFYNGKISASIKLDATDEIAVKSLPTLDADVVIVAIGEDQGSNIMATALFKNLKVKRLISRAINPLHEKVLEALGVDEIVHPEEETAERWAKKLCLKNVLDSHELTEDFSIIEAKVPSEYIGKSIREVGFRRLFNLLVLTIIKKKEVQSLLGKSKVEMKVQGIATPDQTLEETDILVIYGSNNDLQNFLNQNLQD